MRTSTALRRFGAPALLLAACGTAHAQVGFFPLGDLPGGAASSQAFDLSADGRVAVGLGSQIDGIRAVRWVEGAEGASLGNLPGGFGTVANGASADGSVVVGYGFTQMGLMAFRWTEADGLVELGDLPGGAASSYASRVSADGRVVVGDSVGALGQEAFRWTPEGGMVGLGDFPGNASISVALDVSADGAVVVGYGLSVNGFEAFRWTEAGGLEALGDLPGGGYMAQGVGVSGGGDFVVGRSLSSFGQEAFLWSADAGMIALGDLSGGRFDSIANAVTDDGAMVVGRGSTSAGNEALVWTPSTGTMRLADYLASEAGIDIAGWRLIDATSMSSDGSVIAGYGLAPGGGQQAWMVRLRESDPCPEDAFVSVWPPNHKMVTIDVAQAAGLDEAVTVLRVTSDEPVNALHDGATLVDASIDGGVAMVRAERSGVGDGRVYEIRYALNDSECEGSVFVSVPLDEGSEAVDSGQSHDATASALFADINGDGVIDGADLGVLLGEWNMRGTYRDGNGPDSDLNGDGRVLGHDLSALLRELKPRGPRLAGKAMKSNTRRR
ncbi:MAG: dockerin type I domain-containing protein [Phycisphaerales bacterium]